MRGGDVRGAVSDPVTVPITASVVTRTACGALEVKKKVNKGATGVAAGAGVCTVVAGPTPVGAGCGAVGAAAGVVSFVTME